MRSTFDAVVVGGGPAGAGTATGLARLGVRVALATRPAEDAYEGLSGRAAALLRSQRLDQAAGILGVPLPRRAFWAGERSAIGSEYLVARRRLHAALAADAAAAGVAVFEGVTAEPERQSGGWSVCVDRRQIEGRFLVEARGRRVAHARIHGPRLLALAVACGRLDALEPGSSVFAVADGWCWAIVLPDGRGALQFVCEPRAGELHPAQRLVAAIGDREELRPWLAGLDLACPPVARAATAQLAVVGDCVDRLAAGDALVALDPLSGQGIYEALSAVPVSIAAVLGALAGDDASLRARFVAERARAIWVRTVTAAAAFYRAQTVHDEQPFWARAAAGYEGLVVPDRAIAAPEPYLERRPVLNGTRIECASVFVTASQPRGAWQVDGVRLAPLVEEMARDPEIDLEALACRMDRSVESVGRALTWLHRQGIGLMNVESRSMAQYAAVGSGGGES